MPIPFDPQIASQLNDLVENSPPLQQMHLHFDSMLAAIRSDNVREPVPSKSQMEGYHLTTIKNSWEVWKLDNELVSIIILLLHSLVRCSWW